MKKLLLLQKAVEDAEIKEQTAEHYLGSLVRVVRVKNNHHVINKKKQYDNITRNFIYNASHFQLKNIHF